MTDIPRVLRGVHSIIIKTKATEDMKVLETPNLARNHPMMVRTMPGRKRTLRLIGTSMTDIEIKGT